MPNCRMLTEFVYGFVVLWWFYHVHRSVSTQIAGSRDVATTAFLTHRQTMVNSIAAVMFFAEVCRDRKRDTRVAKVATYSMNHAVNESLPWQKRQAKTTLGETDPFFQTTTHNTF